MLTTPPHNYQNIEIAKIKEETKPKIESIREKKSNTKKGEILISSNCKLTRELENEKQSINPIR